MDPVDVNINDKQRQLESLERYPEGNRSVFVKSEIDKLKREIIELVESKPESADVSPSTGMLNEFDSVMKSYIEEDEVPATELYDFIDSLQSNEEKLKAQREIIEIRKKGEYPYIAGGEVLSSPNKS
jgi:hypothetical protein